ncbi:hypothetical protein FFL34_11605 [Lentibacillus cibarius]|uniref:Uncharacterized protein n=1 Tax=Lentibacillus cibarius TaxID=2583219 RepID=A0A5S3QLQ3_9BACI|nr:hypothetical protein FFL34_11605 [Lentibacillus cibarius]
MSQMILRPLSRNITGRPRLLTISSRKSKKIWAQMIGPKHNIRGGVDMISNGKLVDISDFGRFRYIADK